MTVSDRIKTNILLKIKLTITNNMLQIVKFKRFVTEFVLKQGVIFDKVCDKYLIYILNAVNAVLYKS